jgi:hypothetical protein
MYSARFSISQEARMPNAAGFFYFRIVFEVFKPGVKNG